MDQPVEDLERAYRDSPQGMALLAVFEKSMQQAVERSGRFLSTDQIDALVGALRTRFADGLCSASSDEMTDFIERYIAEHGRSKPTLRDTWQAVVLDRSVRIHLIGMIGSAVMLAAAVILILFGLSFAVEGRGTYLVTGSVIAVVAALSASFIRKRNGS